MNKLTMKNVNRRNLTPQGRLTVLKTLLLPQLSHIFASFPSPSDSQMKDLDFFSHLLGEILILELRSMYLQKCITKVI